MNKFTEIIQSFATSINPTKEEFELAEIRYEICISCKYMDKGLIETCNICGCVIKKKDIFTKKSCLSIKKMVNLLKLTFMKYKDLILTMSLLVANIWRSKD